VSMRVSVSTRSLAPALGLALVALFLPAFARAQGSAKRLELSGFVGTMSFTQDLGTTSNIYMTVTGAAENVSFGKLFGFRASWAFQRNFAAEFSATRATNAYSLHVEDAEAGTASLSNQFDASQTFLSGSVIVQFPLRTGLVPYGSVGVGRLATRPESAIEGLEQVSATDVSFGGGVKYWIPSLRFLGLRLDVRYHTASKGLTFPGSGGKPSGTELTVGGVVRLF
jgi:Outer membrane protein beta-barrel domain